MAKDARVLIVGGGIGVLSVAAALGKIGLRTNVYEQAVQLREVGAGVGLWSNAMASLDQIGAGESEQALAQYEHERLRRTRQIVEWSW